MSNENTAVGDVRKKGGLGQRIAYACGNLGQAAFYNAMSTYFIVYVTSCLFSGVDKALAAKLIGIITSLVVIIRIAEIFVDPLLGNLVDNTNTKWGRFRPWQFIGGLISAVLLAVVFSGMFGLVNVNSTLFIVVFVITFIVLDVFYSLRDISYWGMIPALSSDSHERSTYTALGSFTGSIGYQGITVVVIPIVTYFTWMFTGVKGEGQAGWTSFGVIVALLGLITAWTVAFGTKESTSALRAKAQKNGNPFEAFKALFQNDQLLWVALSYLLYTIANGATGGVLLFLFKFILDNPAAFSLTGIIGLVAGLVMTPLYPILNKRIPRRVLYFFGMSFLIVAYILLSISTYSRSMTLVFVALVLFGIPGTFIQMTAILSLTDSIEYGQLKNGRRNEAVTLSVRPMLDKIAGAMSNGITGFIAVAAGMTGSATAKDMTSANIHTFQVYAFYVPLVLIVLSLLVFMLKVKLDEKMHAQIVDELEAKLASGEIVDDEAQTVEAVEAINEETPAAKN
ncbi:glycoside-pentoside-hexuronide (GPH):cation symporter [Bifidobacterium longum]|uniref:glycoside-pentoside-hexuronide (GPH):cation symporter n=1 Tax=Bifidobacterium longum TaxID=216816 RepID=UPI0030F42DA3